MRDYQSGDGPNRIDTERFEDRRKEALLSSSKHERKQSVGIVMTHMLNAVNALHFEYHGRRLIGRHLPFAALLKNQNRHDVLPDKHMLPETIRHTLSACVISWRYELINRLRRHGWLVTDTTLGHLSPLMVCRYREREARR